MCRHGIPILSFIALHDRLIFCIQFNLISYAFLLTTYWSGEDVRSVPDYVHISFSKLFVCSIFEYYQTTLSKIKINRKRTSIIHTIIWHTSRSNSLTIPCRLHSEKRNNWLSKTNSFEGTGFFQLIVYGICKLVKRLNQLNYEEYSCLFLK